MSFFFMIFLVLMFITSLSIYMFFNRTEPKTLPPSEDPTGIKKAEEVIAEQIFDINKMYITEGFKRDLDENKDLVERKTYSLVCWNSARPEASAHFVRPIDIFLSFDVKPDLPVSNPEDYEIAVTLRRKAS